MSYLARRVPLHINQHRHPRSQMPKDMAVKEPNARVIRAETQHGVAATWDLDCVAELGTR